MTQKRRFFQKHVENYGERKRPDSKFLSENFFATKDRGTVRRLEIRSNPDPFLTRRWAAEKEFKLKQCKWIHPGYRTRLLMFLMQLHLLLIFVGVVKTIYG